MTHKLDFYRAEDERLQAHFEWVLTLLRAQPVEGWPAERLARRERTLSLIETYARIGRFPRNRVRSDCMVPVFYDEEGTACAVAFLMENTGAHALASTIHASTNLAFVMEMTREALIEWAEEAGLTLSEAALVQPSYCGPAPDDCHRIEGGCPPGTPGNCACVEVQLDDFYPCYISYSMGQCGSGRCIAGVCKPLVDVCNAPELANDETCKTCVPTSDGVSPGVSELSGCGVDSTGLAGAGGAPATLLAAVFLLALAARRHGRAG